MSLVNFISWVGEVTEKNISYNQQLIIMRLGLSSPFATFSAASTEVCLLNPNYRPKRSYVIITEYDKLSAKPFTPDTAERSAHVAGLLQLPEDREATHDSQSFLLTFALSSHNHKKDLIAIYHKDV